MASTNASSMAIDPVSPRPLAQGEESLVIGPASRVAGSIDAVAEAVDRQAPPAAIGHEGRHVFRRADSRPAWCSWRRRRRRAAGLQTPASAAVMAATMSTPVLAATRAVKVEAFAPWSAWRTKSRLIVSRSIAAGSRPRRRLRMSEGVVLSRIGQGRLANPNEGRDGRRSGMVSWRSGRARSPFEGDPHAGRDRGRTTPCAAQPPAWLRPGDRGER